MTFCTPERVLPSPRIAGGAVGTGRGCGQASSQTCPPPRLVALADPPHHALRARGHGNAAQRSACRRRAGAVRGCLSRSAPLFAQLCPVFETLSDLALEQQYAERCPQKKRRIANCRRLLSHARLSEAPFVRNSCRDGLDLNRRLRGFRRIGKGGRAFWGISGNLGGTCTCL